MWNNEMNINEVVGETILDGYYLSCHFRWYVEHHITPHGLRFMALQSWRTLTCWLEAQKVKEVKVLEKKKSLIK
jgi:hypothetical protein